MYFKRLLLLGILCLSLTCHDNALAEMVSIKGENINMRSGPGTNFEVLYKFGSGMPLDVVKCSGEWLNVKDFEGDVGWVHKSTVSTTPYMVVKANRNSRKNINIRSGPGTNNTIIGTAFYGVLFKTLEKKGSWIKVEHEQGVLGWVESSLLWGF